MERSLRISPLSKKPEMKHLSEKRQRLLASSPYSPFNEDRFVFGDRRFEAEAIVDALAEWVTPERRARIEDVLDDRTRGVATVVEGIVNLGNVSAVMRSAEALGFQSFHIVTGGDTFKDSKRTSQGAEKWLDVCHWKRTADCVEFLKDAGFRIVVTHLDDTSVPISDVDFTRKTALVFGNERDGVSAEMVAWSDIRCVIPTSGFVQSFNVSVAAAVGLYHARSDRVRRQGRHGDLTDAEKLELRAVYYLRSVRHARAILQERTDAAKESGRNAGAESDSGGS